MASVYTNENITVQRAGTKTSSFFCIFIEALFRIFLEDISKKNLNCSTSIFRTRNIFVRGGSNYQIERQVAVTFEILKGDEIYHNYLQKIE